MVFLRELIFVSNLMVIIGSIVDGMAYRRVTIVKIAQILVKSSGIRLSLALLSSLTWTLSGIEIWKSVERGLC